MAVNKNMNSKIMDVMKDLIRMRDGGVGTQNFTVYLATKDNKVNYRSTESANMPRRPQILSESHVLNSTPEAQENIASSRLPRKSSNRPNEDFSRQLNIARNATTHSSQLPLTLENPNDHSFPPRPSKFIPIRETDPKQIAAKIETQSSNVRLTTDEREALISRILTNELEIRSKLTAQVKELYSSPNNENFQRQATPSKLDRKDNDQLMASLMEKRLQIESNRSNQERIIFFPSVRSAVQTEISETPTLDSTSLDTTPVEKSGLMDGTSLSRPRVPVSSRTQQNFGRSLTPIPEASEPRDSVTGARNAEAKNRYDVKTILEKENLRQQQMESRLPSELIQNIETSLLLESSNESDSLAGLVIKDFAVRIVESEPDPATSSLPITEQVMLESDKLKEMMESVKERFQIKVARDKFAERDKQKKLPPNTQPAQGIIEHNLEKSQTFNPISVNGEPASSRMKPINILDTQNWGNVALPKPIFDDFTEPGKSSIDEDVLSERDMQFDDIFGVENVSEPVSLRPVPQYDPSIDHKTIGQSQRQTEPLFDSIENIEDLESPQFSDLPSDVYVRSIAEDLSVSKDLPNFDDPQLEESKIDIERPNEQLSNGTDSVVETEHERDIRKLKELIDSGALTSSIMNQRFEEGVLDLLLRQSDSLWDPIVAGIPIIYFIPSRNHERGLLDTSIKEERLEMPLIRKPEHKLPEYMESLENKWTANNKKNDGVKAGVDSNNNGLVNNNNDEGVLLHGLPTFSYKPTPEYLYRSKINIMDSKDELDDDDILDDREMNFDDLIDNVAEPTYDFQKAKVMDDLEIKMQIIRRMTEKSEAASKSKDFRLPRDVGGRKHKSPPKHPATQNRSNPVDNPVKVRKSVSFVDSLKENEPSKHGAIVRGKAAATPQKNLPMSSEIGRWTTLNISEVKDLIEHARLTHAKHTGTKNGRLSGNKK